MPRALLRGHRRTACRGRSCAPRKARNMVDVSCGGQMYVYDLCRKTLRCVTEVFGKLPFHARCPRVMRQCESVGGRHGGGVDCAVDVPNSMILFGQLECASMPTLGTARRCAPTLSQDQNDCADSNF